MLLPRAHRFTEPLQIEHQVARAVYPQPAALTLLIAVRSCLFSRGRDPEIDVSLAQGKRFSPVQPGLPQSEQRNPLNRALKASGHANDTRTASNIKTYVM